MLTATKAVAAAPITMTPEMAMRSAVCIPTAAGLVPSRRQ
jgi:hypothetical protein